MTNTIASPVKLTKAQAQALSELSLSDQGWSQSWSPGQRLVDLGLAKRHVSKWGSTRFTITDLGRAHPALTTR